MANDVFSTFDAEVKERQKEMLNALESINVDNLEHEGVKLSFGGRTFKFTDLEIVEDEELEIRIRNEFKEKLNSQQQIIREKINTKINQLLLMHQNKQAEFERKETKLKRKYEEAALMPDINEKHMFRGLSVVKGNRHNELIWIYRGTYNPRFILVIEENNDRHRKPVPKKLLNRMVKPMLIIIKTKGSSITSINTKKAEDIEGYALESFPHYHQQSTSGDCWGNWSKPTKWKNADDIIKTAKEAEAILETINHGSIAKTNPAGLPRLDTILKAVKDIKPMSQTNVESDTSDDDDIWQAI